MKIPLFSWFSQLNCLRLPLLGLGLVASAHGQMISDESFLADAGGYAVGQQLPAGPIPSPAVAGYVGNWTTVDYGNEHPAAQAASLAYGGANYAAGAGGSISVPSYTGGIDQNNSGRMYRLLDSTPRVDSSTTGSLYLSFLYQSGQEYGATTYQMLDLYNLNTNDANRTFTAGLTTNGGQSGMQYDFGIQESYTSTGISADTAVHLFVVKFDLSADSFRDSVTVWLDPVLNGGDPVGGFVTNGLDIAFDRIAISNYASTGSGGNSGAWDEIRFGSTLASVTITAVPEPATVGMVGFGLAGMLFLRRGSR